MDEILADTSTYNATDIEKRTISHLRYINYTLITVGPAILIILGIPGNILTMIVLSRRVMQDGVFNVYLKSMCFFNVVSLTIFAFRNFADAWTGNEFIVYSSLLCGLTRWITLTLHSITNWHLIFVTGCRLLFLTKREYHVSVLSCSKYPGCADPRLVILCFCGVCALLQSVVVLKGVVYKNKKGAPINCRLPNNTPWSRLSVVFYSLLPAFLLIIFNIILLRIHYRKKRGLMRSESTTRVRAHLLTLAVLSSLQFIATVVPMAVYQMQINLLIDRSKPVVDAKVNLAVNAMCFFHAAFNCLILALYTNNATNFLIYCFFGRKFRKEFFKTIAPYVQFLCPSECSAQLITSSAMTTESQITKDTHYYSRHAGSPPASESFYSEGDAGVKVSTSV